MNKAKSKISFVIPCFNEAEVLPETISQFLAFCEKHNYQFELIFVDDGSTDSTKFILKNASSKSKIISPVFLSRNFGHQIAVSAGIDFATGDAIIIMDADLQDPLSVVPEMIQLWEQGFEVVYGQRSQRIGESKFKIWTSKVFYRLLNKLSEIPIPLDVGDFRLISKKVADELRLMPESQRYIRGMVAWLGFKQIAITYDRNPRFAGETKYPLIKMVNFATDGLLSFSNKPLRLATQFGAICAVAAFLGSAYLIFMALTTPNLVPGWASTLISIFFIGGVQLFSLGILGEYIGRIYSEVKRRPLYLVEKE